MFSKPLNIFIASDIKTSLLMKLFFKFTLIKCKILSYAHFVSKHNNCYCHTNNNH